MQGKVVIVTGGASGIGRAVVDRLCAEGAVAAVFDLPGAAMDALAAEGRAGVEIFPLDITDEAAVTAAAADLRQRHGAVHGVVNSAGIATVCPAMEVDTQTFRRILDVNVIGCFIVTRAAVAQMEGEGAVVNIASVSGIRGNEGRMAYGASKGAVIMMGNSLSVELAPLGIRVNTVAPGPVDTPMVLAHHSQEMREGWLNALSIKRYALPEEIAEATIFLLDSRRSGFITGHTLAVDGGFLSRGTVNP
ncbi:SDR family NAD(P)-dependent oxidoreductase [Pseudogemmobacter bohemicus]|uniref:SDR family NAD(P)-dependent oxidoreductase n=1 Tax=Pseudogemmobacter bohemicus TaxID=2250708 RepID=UPI0018E59E44|nr:SDR family NAD(P)-dependent oxidoreductase [Pseudogemmobacter bohemicus]